MKLRHIARAFLLLSLAATVTAQESVFKQRIKKFKNSELFIIKYDKAKDYTGIAVGPFAVSTKGEAFLAGTGMSFIAGFEFKGQVMKDGAERFYIRFVSSSNSWRFLENRNLSALIDGERLALGTTEHVGKVGTRVGGLMGGLGSGNSYVIEQLIYILTPEVLSKLANGKSVDMQVGTYELKLKKEQQQALRDLLSLAEPPTEKK